MSKLDLLVRVRYENPLPPPPFPPKLLNIPTHPSRYARFEFASKLADETPFPMIVDADMGMALDLSQYPRLWDPDDEAEDYDLNPDPDNLPELDPKDAFLVSDLASAYGPSASQVLTAASGPSTNVPWLRKTEYLSSSSTANIPALREIRAAEEPVPGVSHASQIASIEASFRAAPTELDLATLQHPTKPKLSALDSYELLPDTRIWANAYDLVKFSERPGDRPPEVPDPRLETAIIRPVIGEDGESYLSYYLTAEDAESELYKSHRDLTYEQSARERAGRKNTEDDDAPIASQKVPFHFVRDYETVKIDMDVPNEFLLMLNESEADASGVNGDGVSDTPKGAFYKNIERKYVLKKKKRQIQREDYGERWDIIYATSEPLTDELWQEREEAVAEVQDPDFLANAVAAQMELDAADTDTKTPDHAEVEHAIEPGSFGHVG